MTCPVCHYYSLQSSQLGEMVGDFSPLQTYISSFSTMKTQEQGLWSKSVVSSAVGSHHQVLIMHNIHNWFPRLELRSSELQRKHLTGRNPPPPHPRGLVTFEWTILRGPLSGIVNQQPCRYIPIPPLELGFDNQEPWNSVDFSEQHRHRESGLSFALL